MNTAAAGTEPRIQDVRVTDDEIVARLTDGRAISVPLAWSWRLSDATPQQRAHFRLIGSGQGIHWPGPKSTVPLKLGKASRGQAPPNKRIQPTRGRRRAQAGGRGARG